MAHVKGLLRIYVFSHVNYNADRFLGKCLVNLCSHVYKYVRLRRVDLAGVNIAWN